METAFPADWNEHCLETWKLNHAADHPDCDLLQIDLGRFSSMKKITRYKPVDLILGGIPCEPISQLRTIGKPSARPTKLEMESWYRLLDYCLAIVKTLSPRWWAIEDVVSIVKHLAPLFAGMDIPVRKIDASGFGPQKRMRAFLGVFPDPLIPNPSSAIPQPLAECLLPGPHLTIPGQDRYERKYMRDGSLPVGNGAMRVCSADYPCPTVTGAISRGSRQRRNWMIETANGQVRILDWRELALAQGFPADYVFAGGHIATEKMVGQAIPIYVGRAILEAICEGAREE